MDAACLAEQDAPSMLYECLTSWCLWMSAASHSPRTIAARRDVVLLFARRSEVDPVTCDWKIVAAFLANPRFMRSTRSTYRAALRQWFAWLIIMELRADNPVDVLPRQRTPRGIPHPVTTDQLGIALTSGRFYRHTRTMILLAAYEGLRAQEIANFRGEQIRNCQIRITGKGYVEALLPLHELIAAEALAYPEIGPWFHTPGDPMTPVTAKNVSRVVGDALRRAGVDATCHQLRHWYGTSSLRSSGGNLRVAQELLRHASPATTAIYTQVNEEEMRAAVAALPVPLHVVPG